MLDRSDELKPRSQHSGRLGMDRMLKDARRGDLKYVQAHLRKDPSLMNAKSGGHHRTFLWEAVRGNQRARGQAFQTINAMQPLAITPSAPASIQRPDVPAK